MNRCDSYGLSASSLHPGYKTCLHWRRSQAGIALGNTRRGLDFMSSLLIEGNVLPQKWASVLFAAGFPSRELLEHWFMCFPGHVCIACNHLSQRWLADIFRGMRGKIILSLFNVWYQKKPVIWCFLLLRYGQLAVVRNKGHQDRA